MLPWDPAAQQGGEKPRDDAPGRYRHQSSTVGQRATAIPEEKQGEAEEDQELFHDSFMAHEEPEEDRIRSAIKGMEVAGAPASPGSVQASRQRHRDLTRSCPLLTVFGGDATDNDRGVVFPPLPSPLAPAPSKTPRSAAAPPASPFSFGLPSPSQAYGNYVAAYTAYVQDRKDPVKATAHLEARRLLELSRLQRQPL
jgi:hypothetical protein